jgi:secreted PhoX family phosphatase
MPAMKRIVSTALVALAFLSVGVVLAASDFGSDRDDRLANHSHELFGVGKPLEASSSASITAAQAQADPTALVTLAKGLKARVVTTQVAPISDQMALWPNDEAPTHLITLNEGGTTAPGLQRVSLADGTADTIVSGTTSGDPVRRTPWGTILFGEEAGGGPNGGRMYELIDPLHTTGVTLNRATGVFSGGIGAENLTARPALGRLSFEGLAIFRNGVVYYGDENRPSSGTPGGAYFKFIPAALRNPELTDPITSLDQSPLVSGTIYGLRLGRRAGGTDYGQGTQTGFGTWVLIPAAPDPDLRAQAAALKLTGYYRPEDMDIDLAAKAKGDVRICGANTGNERDDQDWGGIICITDGGIDDAAHNGGITEVQFFVMGSPDFAMPDNVAYQPSRGNWIFHEDADTEYLRPHNNDLWDCLPDGSDADLLSDGCIRIATLNDLTAEWTGGIFDASGKHFYVSVQHNISGGGTILDITGWD